MYLFKTLPHLEVVYDGIKMKHGVRVVMDVVVSLLCVGIGYL